MKSILSILTLASFAWLMSCTKKIDVVHDIHDTVYLTQIKVDTFHSIVIRTDTIIKHDNSEDTVIRHDTLFLTKITTDTLFRSYIDTVYLTKALHDTIVQVKTVVQHDTVINTQTVLVPDTVTKLVYLHDTIDNIVKVFIRDTVVQVNTIVEHDTVLKYQPVPGYPTPATDSVLIEFFMDSSKITLHSITFTSLLPSPDGTFQTVITLPVRATHGSTEETDYNGIVVVAPKMLCRIVFDYDVYGGAVFELDTFDPFQFPKQWIVHSSGQIACNPCHITTTSFDAVPIGEIASMSIR
jgi:hypothetical protein